MDVHPENIRWATTRYNADGKCGEVVSWFIGLGEGPLEVLCGPTLSKPPWRLSARA